MSKATTKHEKKGPIYAFRVGTEPLAFHDGYISAAAGVTSSLRNRFDHEEPVTIDEALRAAADLCRDRGEPFVLDAVRAGGK